MFYGGTLSISLTTLTNMDATGTDCTDTHDTDTNTDIGTDACSFGQSLISRTLGGSLLFLHRG